MIDAPDQPPTAVAITVIEPPPRWPPPRLTELWRYRELLHFLTWRDVKVRYKQTVLGAGWAVLQPVLAMVVFTIVLGRLAELDSEGAPYSVFAYAALVPWTFFANAMNQSAVSLIVHERIIAKVYFPRLLLPVAAVLAMAVDFALAFAVLIVLMAANGIAPGVSRNCAKPEKSTMSSKRADISPRRIPSSAPLSEMFSEPVSSG